MQIRFSYHNLEKAKCQPNIEEYANENKLKALQKLLTKDELKEADLYLRIEYFVRHNSYALTFRFKTVKISLVAKEVSHTLTKAFDITLEKIINQLRKKKAKN
ncbi:HPF/RaiA family ribosome-associated protein [Candidatus Gribaldobacteria bacterium]|nr:HPF/RaiA family ribosome-associated protein [Candidatus Gribaldobacteria bacterium]